MEHRDVLGKPIFPGDRLCHVVRRGSVVTYKEVLVLRLTETDKSTTYWGKVDPALEVMRLDEPGKTSTIRTKHVIKVG